jgi:putative nucleotidyltransferase with HDIG domain
MKECPSKDPIVKLAALLHDIGKPKVASTDNDGHIIFYNHEVVGAKIAKSICERLRLSNNQKEKVFTLIRWHMFTVDENITDSAVRRFIRRVGIENVKDMIDLRIGDRLGGGTQTAESWRLKKFKERLSEQLNPPFSINDMAIDGNDIMRELGISPGKRVGEILNALFLEVDEDLTKNNKDYLMSRLQELKTSRK